MKKYSEKKLKTQHHKKFSSHEENAGLCYSFFLIDSILFAILSKKNYPVRSILSNLISFTLPLTGLFIIPSILLGLFGTDSISSEVRYPPGIIIFSAGMTLLIITIRLMIIRGKGTLAAWDPAKKLVVTGPYKHTRNPMISGVIICLLGESVFFGSLSLLIWAVLFFIINNIYFKLYEEPS